MELKYTIIKRLPKSGKHTFQKMTSLFQLKERWMGENNNNKNNNNKIN